MSSLVLQSRATRRFVVALAASMGLLGLSSFAQDATFGLQAKKLLTGTGQVLEDGVILVENGKIRAVGSKLEIPAGWRVLQHDGVVMPGLIDAGATLGGTELYENQEAVSPDLNVADGLDLWDPSFDAWMRSGVTSVHVIPPIGNVMPGLSVVVKTGGPRTTRLLHAEAGLELGLNRGSRRRDRAPSSLQGSAQLLRDLFASSEASSSVERVKRGELPIFAHVDGLDEVRVAARLTADFKWKTRLMGPSLPDEVLAYLGEAKLPLVLRPLDYGSDARVKASYGALGRTTHPLAFASLARGGGDAGLRRGAALAVRSGLDADVAVRALTSGAAAILGVEQRVGSLAPGRDADLLWLDGHPLDLGTRVVAVFIDGQRVDHSAGGN